MPYKNIIKTHAEGCWYHAYNRGHNKQIIFRSERDYRVFIYQIRKFLEPDFFEVKIDRAGELIKIKPDSLIDEVELHAYCLMPNHFHFLVYQKTRYGMSRLIAKIAQAYTAYFNEKYERVGSAWQGTYKAVKLESDEQFIHLAKYIHANPFAKEKKSLLEIESDPISFLEKYPYSSLQNYIGSRKNIWLKTQKILEFYKSKNNNPHQNYKKSMSDFLRDTPF
jgi:putative transposase